MTYKKKVLVRLLYAMNYKQLHVWVIIKEFQSITFLKVVIDTRKCNIEET